MCGICGRVAFTGGAAAEIVEEMSRRLSHRGPDDSGAWSDGAVALAHRRLSIIDLSPSGHQPMLNEDGSLVLAFNGEIYNYQELRKNFVNEIAFRRNNDSEVILKLYEKFGPGCLDHLRGMFAIAIWDAKRGELFLARDRLGKKPLFYTIQNQALAFASELHALLANRDFHFEVDAGAISRYLSLQYIPSPLSIYRGVFKLPPAHYAVFSKDGLKVERYWTLRHTRRDWSEPEATERFGELFAESVRLRMIADVPLGAFLSGGVDSSAVVSLMCGLSSQPVKTFSIRFEEDAFDESRFAAQVAAHCGTEHHEFCVKPNYVEILPDLIRHFSEPFADSSALPVYYLSRMTREHVTVALTGDGGDETFGGYPRYHLPAPETNPLAAALVPLKGVVPPNMRFLWRFRRWIDAGTLSLPANYMNRICYFQESQKENLFTPEFARDAGPGTSLQWFEEQFAEFGGVPYPENLMGVDIRTYLPDDLLVKSDIATMYCALEARSPFLDHKLMEFAATLPADFKIRNGVSKYLLKQYLRPRLPQAILDRPKMGFGTPITVWFRDSLSGYLEDILLSPQALNRGYFRKRSLEKMIHRHRSGLYDYAYHLYALLVLELWHREFPHSTHAA